VLVAWLLIAQSQVFSAFTLDLPVYVVAPWALRGFQHFAQFSSMAYAIVPLTQRIGFD